MISTSLNWVSIVCGFLAALLWFNSTLAKVPPDPHSSDFQITETGNAKPYDVLETIKRQVVWNRWAALATALAVLSQALAMFLRSVILC